MNFRLKSFDSVESMLQYCDQVIRDEDGMVFPKEGAHLLMKIHQCAET